MKQKIFVASGVAAGVFLIALTVLSGIGYALVGALKDIYFMWPGVIGAASLTLCLRSHKFRKITGADLVAYTAALAACEFFAAVYGGSISIWGIRPVVMLLPALVGICAGPIPAVIVSLGAGFPVLLNIPHYPEMATYIAITAVGSILSVAVFSLALVYAIEKRGSASVVGCVVSVLDYFLVTGLFNTLAAVSIGISISPVGLLIVGIMTVAAHAAIYLFYRHTENGKKGRG